MATFVAAEAGQRFARVNVSGASHRLHRDAVFVQRLEVERNAGRRFETNAPVFLDRNRAENLAGAVFAGVTDPRLVRVPSRFRENLDDSQLLNFRSFRERTVRFVNVDDADGRGFRQLGGDFETVFLRFRNPDERLVRNDRRNRARLDRSRPLAADFLVAVQENLVPERVEEVKTVTVPFALGRTAERVVNDEEEVFAKRVRLTEVVRRAVRADLRFREELFRRDSLNRPHRVAAVFVVFGGRVDQNDGAEVLRVVPGRRPGEENGVGNLVQRRFEVRARTFVFGVVPLNRASVATVRERNPRMVRLVETAVDVIPTGVNDHPGGVDRRRPFVRFVNAKRNNVASVGVHRVERVTRAGARVAATVTAATFRDKDDSTVRHKVRIEVVPRAVGQLNEVGSVDIDAEEVVAVVFRPNVGVALRRRVRGGEVNRFAVVS